MGLELVLVLGRSMANDCTGGLCGFACCCGGGPGGRLSMCCGTAVCDRRGTGSPVRVIRAAASRPSSIDARRRSDLPLVLDMDSFLSRLEASGDGAAAVSFADVFFDPLLAFLLPIFSVDFRDLAMLALFDGGGLVGLELWVDEPVFWV
jgi:hypothetical protein